MDKEYCSKNEEESYISLLKKISRKEHLKMNILMNIFHTLEQYSRIALE